MAKHIPSSHRYGVGTFVFAGHESISDAITMIDAARGTAADRFMEDAQLKVAVYSTLLAAHGVAYASQLPAEVAAANPYVSPILPAPLTFPSMTKIKTKASWKWRRPRMASVPVGTGDAKHDATTSVGLAACAALGFEYWASSPVPAGYWAVTPERTYTHVRVNRNTATGAATVTERDETGATLRHVLVEDFDALVATHGVTLGAQLELTA